MAAAGQALAQKASPASSLSRSTDRALSDGEAKIPKTERAVASSISPAVQRQGGQAYLMALTPLVCPDQVWMCFLGR